MCLLVECDEKAGHEAGSQQETRQHGTAVTGKNVVFSNYVHCVSVHIHDMSNNQQKLIYIKTSAAPLLMPIRQHNGQPNLISCDTPFNIFDNVINSRLKENAGIYTQSVFTYQYLILLLHTTSNRGVNGRTTGQLRVD